MGARYISQHRVTLLARSLSAQGVHVILAPSASRRQPLAWQQLLSVSTIPLSPVARLSSRCDKNEEGLSADCLTEVFVWTTTPREGRKNREKPRNVRQNTIKRPSLNSSYTPPSLEPEREGWAEGVDMTIKPWRHQHSIP